MSTSKTKSKIKINPNYLGEVIEITGPNGFTSVEVTENMVEEQEYYTALGFGHLFIVEHAKSEDRGDA